MEGGAPRLGDHGRFQCVDAESTTFSVCSRAGAPNTGIVCAPPIGSRPESFAAEIECAFLNTYQARWQYAGESCGYGFAQGKTMLWRREILEAGGGIEALGAEIAEDAAATKLIRAQGFNAHLVDRPFQQPLGQRRLRDVWSRQLRWARLRRATFPFFFAPEILTTSLLTFVAAGGRRAGIRDEPDRRRRCWRLRFVTAPRRSSPSLQAGRCRGAVPRPGSRATSCCRSCGRAAGPAATSSGAATPWMSTRRCSCKPSPNRGRRSD